MRAVYYGPLLLIIIQSFVA